MTTIAGTCYAWEDDRKPLPRARRPVDGTADAPPIPKQRADKTIAKEKRVHRGFSEKARALGLATRKKRVKTFVECVLDAVRANAGASMLEIRAALEREGRGSHKARVISALHDLMARGGVRRVLIEVKPNRSHSFYAYEATT